MPTSAKNIESTAEQRFRQAFERMKLAVPERLPKGAPVSQNNVAKEAGCDPSALRKARFPLLIIEIQEWVAAHKRDDDDSGRQKLLKQRRKNRDAREMIIDLKQQRDMATGLLADANLRILELTEELAEMRARLHESRPAATVLNFKRDL